MLPNILKAVIFKLLKSIDSWQGMTTQSFITCLSIHWRKRTTNKWVIDWRQSVLHSWLLIAVSVLQRLATRWRHRVLQWLATRWRHRVLQWLATPRRYSALQRLATRWRHSALQWLATRWRHSALQRLATRWRLSVLQRLATPWRHSALQWVSESQCTATRWRLHARLRYGPGTAGGWAASVTRPPGPQRRWKSSPASGRRPCWLCTATTEDTVTRYTIHDTSYCHRATTHRIQSSILYPQCTRKIKYGCYKRFKKWIDILFDRGSTTEILCSIFVHTYISNNSLSRSKEISLVLKKMLFF